MVRRDVQCRAVSDSGDRGGVRSGQRELFDEGVESAVMTKTVRPKMSACNWHGVSDTLCQFRGIDGINRKVYNIDLSDGHHAPQI